MINTSNIIGNTLSWLVVKDLDAAIDYYTKVLGFSVECHTKEFGWAELSAPKGAIVALCQENPHAPYKSGTNAVITIEVKDIEMARKTLISSGSKLCGEIQEIPGHVKMQTFEDFDGNMMQFAEKLN